MVWLENTGENGGTNPQSRTVAQKVNKMKTTLQSLVQDIFTFRCRVANSTSTLRNWKAALKKNEYTVDMC